MILERFLIMSTKEVKRLSMIEKVIDKKFTQLIAAIDGWMGFMGN